MNKNGKKKIMCAHTLFIDSSHKTTNSSIIYKYYSRANSHERERWWKREIKIATEHSANQLKMYGVNARKNGYCNDKTHPVNKTNKIINSTTVNSMRWILSRKLTEIKIKIIYTHRTHDTNNEPEICEAFAKYFFQYIGINLTFFFHAMFLFQFFFFCVGFAVICKLLLTGRLTTFRSIFRGNGFFCYCFRYKKKKR